MVKINVEIDCTPQEARQFLGLPDIEPMNKMVMATLEERMKENLATMTDPEKLMNLWMAMGGQSLSQMQKFMGAATQTATKKTE